MENLAIFQGKRQGAKQDKSRATRIGKENGAGWKEDYRLVYDGSWWTSRNARPV